MQRYPLFLDLVDKAVLIVGGGQVAERKARLLLEANAKITIIAPELTPNLKKLP